MERPLRLPIGVVVNLFQIMEVMLDHEELFDGDDFVDFRQLCHCIEYDLHYFWKKYPWCIGNEDGVIEVPDKEDVLFKE